MLEHNNTQNIVTDLYVHVRVRVHLYRAHRSDKSKSIYSVRRQPLFIAFFPLAGHLFF